MRLRIGLVIGFSIGYYLGAKAGRTRYLQLREWLEHAKDSGVVETATDKAMAVVDLGIERARELLERHDDDIVDLTTGSERHSPSR